MRWVTPHTIPTITIIIRGPVLNSAITTIGSLKPIGRIGITGGFDRKSSVSIGNGVMSTIRSPREGPVAVVQGGDNRNGLTC